MLLPGVHVFLYLCVVGILTTDRQPPLIVVGSWPGFGLVVTGNL
jgi:hypothetical protein